MPLKPVATNPHNADYARSSCFNQKWLSYTAAQMHNKVFEAAEETAKLWNPYFKDGLESNVIKQSIPRGL